MSRRPFFVGGPMLAVQSTGSRHARQGLCLLGIRMELAQSHQYGKISLRCRAFAGIVQVQSH